MSILEKYTLDRLREAHKRISKYVNSTPCRYSHYLSEMTGAEVYLKMENLQQTGSYKIRGAVNRIGQLSKAEKEAGIVACSAGNHAQGVALAAQIFKIPTTIVMPKMTPLSKVEGTRKYGAKIVLHGNGFGEAFEKMKEIQKEKGMTLVHPFNDEDIIAGQSTVGIEILDQIPDVEEIFVPVGGGGLASGIGLATHFLKPKVKLIGIEAEQMASMKKSISNRKVTPVDRKSTIAEGIAVSSVLDKTFDLVSHLYNDILTVSESEIARNMVRILEREKVLCEGAGAVAYALLSEKQYDVKGKKVCAVLTGGNVDLNFLSKVVERGLGEDGRLANLQVIVPDVPGSMAKISSIIADYEANILEIFHNRVFAQAGVGETAINVVVECKGYAHQKEIVEGLEKVFKVNPN
jgi:threonine dehydratase